MNQERLRMVLTTFDDEAVARRIAARLVEEGLVACAQLSTAPIESVYRWQGEVQTAREWRLVLKLPAHRTDALRERLVALHPYDTPQFVVLAASASAEYEQWVRESCS